MRIGFPDLYPNECRASAVQFLRNTLTYFGSPGARVRRALTDNDSAFRSKACDNAYSRIGLKHSLTRPYEPQINGNAERFIHSQDRAAALDRWIHR